MHLRRHHAKESVFIVSKYYKLFRENLTRIQKCWRIVHSHARNYKGPIQYLDGGVEFLTRVPVLPPLVNHSWVLFRILTTSLRFNTLFNDSEEFWPIGRNRIGDNHSEPARFGDIPLSPIRSSRPTIQANPHERGGVRRN